MTNGLRKRQLTAQEKQEADKLKTIWMEKKRALKLTQGKAADLLDISQSGVSSYLNGINALNLGAAAVFADMLGVRISDFSPRLASQAEKVAKAQTPEPIAAWSDVEDLDEGYVKVPRLDARLSAGNGDSLTEEPLRKPQPQSFRREWIERNGWRVDNLYCMYASGRSMEPRIYDGDTLLIDVSKRRPIDGQVFAIRYASDLRVKRLYWKPGGGLIIQSDNTDGYPPIHVSADQINDLEIVGQVVWKASEHI